jgi:hypothetical protein
MDAGEVVVYVKQCHRVHVVVDLLGESIGQASEPAHLHSHVQVLPFHVGRRNMNRIGCANHYRFGDAKDCSWAVALLRLGTRSVNLDQLCVVYLFAKRIRDGFEVHLVAVRVQLDSIRQSTRYILKELRGATGIAPAEKPADNELRICVNRCESPNVSSVPDLLPHLCRGILLFGITERPNLIDLDALGRNVPHNAIMVLLTRRSDFLQQPEDCTPSLRRSSATWSGWNTLRPGRKQPPLSFPYWGGMP